MNQLTNSGRNIPLLLYILFLAPLGIYLQELFFATSNAYSALYMIVTSLLIVSSPLGFRYVDKSLKVLLFFFLIIFVGTIFSGSYLYFLQSLMIFLFVFFGGCEDLNSVRKYIKLITWVGVLMAFSCIFELVNYESYLSIVSTLFKPDAVDSIVRLSVGGDMCGFMPQTSHAAGIILFSIFSLFLFDSRESKIFKYAILIILLFGIFLTAKRAHLIFGTLALLLSYVIGYSGSKRVKRFIQVTAIAAIGILVIFTFVAPNLGEENVLTEIQYTIENINNESEDVGHGRSELSEAAIKMAESAPLTGHGWGSFKKTYSYRGGSTDVHNVFLQLFAEMGIFVCILFVFAITLALRETIRVMKYANKTQASVDYIRYLQYSFSVQAFFIAYCFTGNSLYNVDFLAMYGFAIALMVSVKRKVYA